MNNTLSVTEINSSPFDSIFGKSRASGRPRQVDVVMGTYTFRAPSGALTAKRVETEDTSEVHIFQEKKLLEKFSLTYWDGLEKAARRTHPSVSIAYLINDVAVGSFTLPGHTVVGICHWLQSASPLSFAAGDTRAAINLDVLDENITELNYPIGVQAYLARNDGNIEIVTIGSLPSPTTGKIRVFSMGESADVSPQSLTLHM